MEVSQEVIPRSTGKTIKPVVVDTADKTNDVFWDAYWTLDDDDQQPDNALVQL